MNENSMEVPDHLSRDIDELREMGRKTRAGHLPQQWSWSDIVALEPGLRWVLEYARNGYFLNFPMLPKLGKRESGYVYLLIMLNSFTSPHAPCRALRPTRVYEFCRGYLTAIYDQAYKENRPLVNPITGEVI